MIPKECKRLAEVDFPIAVVSKHSVREKPVVRRHPQSFHQWWARRPLAACRAMLLGLLLPDPCDPLCPTEFKTRARAALAPLPQPLDLDDHGLRRGLLRFIGDFANWDLAANPTYLAAARELVKAAHPEETPLVVDPFAGGGSIPLEALRLGCEAFASDLNPVACLVLEVMLEDIPRHGPELAEEFRRVSGEIKKAAEKELAEFYPTDPDGARPIAYLWARTVRCESPNCGAEIPLARSFWLCTKANRLRALKHRVVRPNGEVPHVEFEVFEPGSGKDVPAGAVARAKATCLCCGMVLAPDRVRAQLAEQRGGADAAFDARGKRTGGARMLAVVTLRQGMKGRDYRLPAEHDYQAVWRAQGRLRAILDEWGRGGKKGLCPVPDEPLNPIRPSPNARGLSAVTRYGMGVFGDLFTARQKVLLAGLATLLAGSTGPAIGKLTALVVSRLADRHASLLGWDTGGEKLGHVFNRQALPMVWDYAEGCPLADATGSYANVFEQIEGAVQSVTGICLPGQMELADAGHSSLPSEAATVWFTDPPYYDAVPYADLSDFFFVWLKRALPGCSLLRDPYDPSNLLTPKTAEAVWNQSYRVNGTPKDGAFYEAAMGCAFGEGRRVLREDGIACVVFAHKTTEGWEALLTGLVQGGWTITGSWPIATERTTRVNAQETASLATSVHLVCRPRLEDAPVGDWGEVLRELPKRVGDWMERLQNEGIRGADLVFACIGPALEIYSRYRRVEDAQGREIPLGGDPQAAEAHRRGYLAYVWEAVGRCALEQILGTAEAKARNGAAGALEEDARLTALFLWTLQATGSEEEGGTGEGAGEGEAADDDDDSAVKRKKKGYTLVFDVARRFAQPLGIELPKWEGRIIETEKGVVRLLPIAERAEQLFGDSGAAAVANWLEEGPGDISQMLLPGLEPAAAPPKIRGRRGRIAPEGQDVEMKTEHAATTLDRVHAAMLLQAGGQSNALRALIKTEQERGPDFLRLANALSALYPIGSEEKRLLDAMLLAVPR